MSRAHELVEQLQDEPSLGIVCHDHPDPDCIASALALRTIAEHVGVESIDIFYSGRISHHQNRALVNLLDIEMQQYGDEFTHGGMLALVDNAVPGVHNRLSPDTAVDIVIDHHPQTEQTPAAFADIRVDFGSTATILTEYLRELDVDVPPRVASGLLFGLHRERLDFVHHPTRHEYEAACFLYDAAKIDLLQQLYGASFTAETVDVVGEAIRSRVVRGAALATCVGRTTNPDALAQAADYLLNIEGVDTTFVSGIVRDELRLSARSIDPGIDVGARLREAFGDIGSAGGHPDMAGGQVSLGIFGDLEDAETELIQMVGDRANERFFSVMNLKNGTE